jgi:hypothetical protein
MDRLSLFTSPSIFDEKFRAFMRYAMHQILTTPILDSIEWVLMVKIWDSRHGVMIYGCRI